VPQRRPDFEICGSKQNSALPVGNSLSTAPRWAGGGDAAPSSTIANSGATVGARLAPQRLDSAGGTIAISDRSATAKTAAARQFLSSIEGAKSAPAKPSHVLRRAAASQASAPESHDAHALAADFVNCADGEDQAAEASRGADGTLRDSSVLSKEQVRNVMVSSGSEQLQSPLHLGEDAPLATSGRPSAANESLQPRPGLASSGSRSKAAVPLVRYIRDIGASGGGMNASEDANATLAHSCHLHQAADGRGLVVTDKQVLAAGTNTHFHTRAQPRTMPLSYRCSQNCGSPAASELDSPPRSQLPHATAAAHSTANLCAAATTAAVTVTAGDATRPAQLLQQTKRPLSASVMRPLVRYLGCDRVACARV